MNWILLCEKEHAIGGIQYTNHYYIAQTGFLLRELFLQLQQPLRGILKCLNLTPNLQVELLIPLIDITKGDDLLLALDGFWKSPFQLLHTFQSLNCDLVAELLASDYESLVCNFWSRQSFDVRSGEISDINLQVLSVSLYIEEGFKSKWFLHKKGRRYQE